MPTIEILPDDYDLTKEVQKTYSCAQAVLSDLSESLDHKVTAPVNHANQSLFDHSTSQVNKKMKSLDKKLSSSVERVESVKDSSDLFSSVFDQIKEGLYSVCKVLLEILSFLKDLLKSDSVKNLSQDDAFKEGLKNIDRTLGVLAEMIKGILPSIQPRN